MLKPYFILILIGLQNICISQSTHNKDIRHPYFRDNFDYQKARIDFRCAWNKDGSARKEGRRDLRIMGYFSQNVLLSGGNVDSNIPIIKANKLDSSRSFESFRGYTGNYPIPIFDSVGIIITISGINRENADRFEYRVLKNGKEDMVPWQQCKLFCAADMTGIWGEPDIEEVAYVGQFKQSVGTKLLFQVREKGGKEPLVGFAAYWLERSPSIIGVYSSTKNMNEFLTVLKVQWQMDPGTNIEDYMQKLMDSLLTKRDTFQYDETSLIFYLEDKVRSKEIIEYNLVQGRDSSGWKSNDFDQNFIWLRNLSPGSYKLLMRYSVQRQSMASYKFVIIPAWYQTNRFYLVLGVLTAILLGAIAALVISVKQRRQIKHQKQEKQRVQIELKSIRSQFNPHFVFNALNSIQGLIRKKDVERADHYLSEFSQLMRESLQTGAREMVSLDKEINMLKSYIELEKLRFGFTYEFEVDEKINNNTIEIPTLLLQPLIENAIKHGIAHLYEKGRLLIEITILNNDMRILIKDNGKGFDSAKFTSGYGLKLTKERLQLLSELNVSQPITVAQLSGTEGTTMQLLFKNWLL